MLLCCNGKCVRYKKYFYALRPLLAAQYIERYHKVPPVPFDELLELKMPQELRTAIDVLLEKKKQTTEKEVNSRMPVIQAFIESETIRQKELADHMEDDRNKDWTALNRIFRATIC